MVVSVNVLQEGSINTLLATILFWKLLKQKWLKIALVQIAPVSCGSQDLTGKLSNCDLWYPDQNASGVMFPIIVRTLQWNYNQPSAFRQSYTNSFELFVPVSSDINCTVDGKILKSSELGKNVLSQKSLGYNCWFWGGKCHIVDNVDIT